MERLGPFIVNSNMMQDGAKPSAAVLIVERHVLVRLELSEYLRGCGYKVIATGTADEALIVLVHAINQFIS